MITKEQV